MGYMHCSKPKGQSLFDFFSKEFNYDNDGATGKVLDVASVLPAAYIAYQVTQKDTGKSYVLAVICKIDHTPNNKEGLTFGYKDMEESSGPYYHDCPARIFKQLSPLEEIYDAGTSSLQYATEWRAGVVAQLERRARSKALKPGAVVKFAEPLRFSGYDEDKNEMCTFVSDTFKYSPSGAGNRKRHIFVDVATKTRIRVRNWRTCAFTLVEAAA